MVGVAGQSRTRRRGAAAALALLSATALAATVLSGCGLFRSAAAAPKALTGALTGTTPEAPPDPVAQQQELMRVATVAVSGFSQAATEFTAKVGTQDAVVDGARWRLRVSQTALALATRPDTVAAMLELIVALRLTRVVIEIHYAKTYGDAAVAVAKTVGVIEAEAWTGLERVAGKERAAAAKKGIEEWAAGLGDSDVDETLLLRRPSLDEVLVKESSGRGFWSWLDIDPFAGLEPAAREIALMRLFAERVLFYAQYAPRLVHDEVQLAVLTARRQPEVVQLFDDLEKISVAAASMGRLADELPAAVATERQAALTQLSAELDAQRRGIVEDLEHAKQPLTELLAASRSTMEATSGTSRQLTELVHAVDAFLARFDAPAGEATAPKEAAVPSDAPPSKPFDIADYGDAATRLAEAARDLTALVAQLDSTLPKVELTVDTAAVRVERSIDRVLVRVLLLGIGLIAAAAAAVWFVRRRKGSPAA